MAIEVEYHYLSGYTGGIDLKESPTTGPISGFDISVDPTDGPAQRYGKDFGVTNGNQIAFNLVNSDIKNVLNGITGGETGIDLRIVYNY